MIVGSCSFFASAFLNLRYSSVMFVDVVGNSLSFILRSFFVMYCFSISKVCGFSLPILPMVCFAPMMLTVPFCRLMSAILSHVSSMGLVPISLLIDRNRHILGVALAISMSIFSSCGIFGSLS